MCPQKRNKKSIFLASFAILAIITGFSGCDAVDSMLSSTGTYKVNAQVDGVSLSERSFVSSDDEITPFFEESVSGDPDITSLIITIQDSSVVYSLKKETVQYKGSSTRTMHIENLDKEFPSFKVPADLPAGLYQMVFQIMSGNDVLQRTEKDFYFLGDKSFVYKGIQLYLPGISGNSQMISRGQVVMLEAKLNFESSLDPYIVWYDGQVKLAEGSYSEGANILLWKAPEQSNFYPIYAEVFPVKSYNSLAGYQKSISILVSSNAEDVNLIQESIPELVHWYLFEGDLDDSSTQIPDEQRAIKPVYDNKAKWVSSDGTYGLATGQNNVFMLPKVSISTYDTLQMLLRIKPLNNGKIAAVNFDSSFNTALELSVNENNLVLTLSSPLTSVSRSYNLPVNEIGFHIIGVNFNIRQTQISADVNILDEIIEQDDKVPLSLEAVAANAVQVFLGYAQEEDESVEPEFTALWDEFALYINPSMDLNSIYE